MFSMNRKIREPSTATRLLASPSRLCLNTNQGRGYLYLTCCILIGATLRHFL